MIKCPKCGNLIENYQAKFCKKCGTKLHNSQSINTEVVNNNGSNASSVVDNGENILSSSDLRKPSLDNSKRILEKPISPSGNFSHYSDTHDRPKMKLVDPVKVQPKDYLIWSVLVTLFCCWPIGIYAIVCSTRVSKHYRLGNYIEALNYSKKAKKWSLISFLITLAFYIIILIGIAIDESEQDSYDTDSSLITYEEEVVECDSVALDLECDSVALDLTPNELLLQYTINSERGSLPVDIGDGMTMTDMKISGDYVYYEILCDEDKIDISLIDKSIAKNLIIASFKENTSEDIQLFLNMCKQANKGIAYKYIGDESGKSVIVRVSSYEL